MVENATLTSVGIDVGTTTTQLVISRLTLSNVMPGSQIPRIEVCHKSVIYLGDIYFTPFIDRRRVDGPALRGIIAGEYEKAGVRPGDIDTGAIIITGETAKKDNASEIVHSLAEYAGDFVVAAAGPDLEGMIAGKGSGAAALSLAMHACIANVDVGGGTTNIAFFDRGKCLGTACANVGGRLFEVDLLTHRLSYVAPPALKVVAYLKSKGMIRDGDPAEDEMSLIQQSLTAMVGSVERVILGEPLNYLDKELIMTNSLPVIPLDGMVFSGGVASYVYQPAQGDWWVHGDVGPLLAEAFRRGRIFSSIRVLRGSETIHATVLGAGAHTVNVSGSTITVDGDHLPLRNLPAIYPEVVAEGVFSWWRQAESFRGSLYKTVALVVPYLPDTSFAAITRLAKSMASELARINRSPVVIVAQQDIAKVLGQSLQRLLGPVALVCLDGIELQMGDYLDIARPLPHQEAVPVIVKTLVFAH